MGVTVREKPRGSGIHYLFMHENGTTTSKRVGRNKQEALRLARETQLRMVRDQINPPLPTLPPSAVVTVGDVARQWLDWIGAVRADLRESSREHYARMIDRYIVPGLGSIDVAALTIDDVETFCTRLRRPGGSARWTARGLAPASLAAVLNPLRQVLSWAQRKHLCAVNVARQLDRGIAARRPGDVAQAEPDPFTPAELRALVAAAAAIDPAIADPLELWVRTGLRRGEWLALTWADLDLVRGVVTVARTWSRDRLSPTKTGKIRRVSFGSPVLEDVDTWKAWSTPEAIALLERLRAPVVQPLDPARVYLVGGGDAPGPGRDWQRTWARILRRSGVRPRPAEQFRHSMASTLLSRGAPNRMVQDLGGWASSAILDKHYSKFMPCGSDAPPPPRVGTATRQLAPPARLVSR